MELAHVHLAPEVRSLASLGFADAAAVFAAPRAREDAAGARVDSVRCAHPTGGTLVVRCFREASFGEWRRARFTPPRSLSLAEREWNLFCHLRAHGISTPEPLAVGRGRGALFARESFLVLRELDHLRPVTEWARAPCELRARGGVRLAQALGELVARVFRAGVWLPDLHMRALAAAAPRERIRGTEACALHQIAERRGLAPRAPFDDHLAWNELPEAAVIDVAGGRVVRGLGAREREATVRSLARSLGAIDARLLARVERHALATRDS
ncbi:MAG: lipopolysaccharide kinase InaA family protein [Planctomycetota bacterium]